MIKQRRCLVGLFLVGAGIALLPVTDTIFLQAMVAQKPAPAPSPVKKVKVTPVQDEKGDDGRVLLEAEIADSAKHLVLNPLRFVNSTHKKEGFSRVLTLDLGKLEDEAKRYIRDLKTAKSAVRIAERQQFQIPVPAALPAVGALSKGGELPEFLGLPALQNLDPTLEKKLIGNSLMITSTKVVEDERAQGNGVWTFAHLMTHLANEPVTGTSPDRFIRRWLKHWEDKQVVNEFEVKARPKVGDLILKPWEEASGGAGKPLDLTKAPFRLLAIVSRLDLRSNLVMGAERIGGGAAGEARFVFCAINVKDGGKPLQFTVIFEYGIKKNDYHDIQAWGKQWYALKDLELGSKAYNESLEKITEQFVRANADPESPPNRSALSQLRTNEVALDFPWELREFRIDAFSTGLLRQVTVQLTPDRDTFNQGGLKNQDFADFVNTNEADIVHKKHRVPVLFKGNPFKAGSALTDPKQIWNAQGKINNPEARHLFSLNTCNACHAGETFRTFAGANDPINKPAMAPGHFTHVAPRIAGEPSQVSAFLSGKEPDPKDPAKEIDFLLPDPVDGMTLRPFKDLSNRAHDLHGLVQYGRYYEAFRLPRQRVH